jgi:hypothetical protein
LLLFLSAVAVPALVALEGLLVTGRSAGAALPSVCRKIKRKVIEFLWPGTLVEACRATKQPLVLLLV